ncbi:expressed protein [Chlorella variabilis]|uniref:Expressed protein n=1 Tax=Chlorella variabilis TaxID=554065 RepID=E1ZML5_CHLVA|nr:expressed protein [Chlorella variabilis]EFN53136.1 expressed protein [Chlorella variabilis]|eukprot:XP_005845238.1 expressed protein [Chlorella variabilis]
MALPTAAAGPCTAATGGLDTGDDLYSFGGGNTQASQDEIDQYVQHVVEHEIESINQAVHAAFEQELEQVNQTVQDAVETALLDCSFDIKANFNTMIALTGVILYWRGIWNLFDGWLGTENLAANVLSVVIGVSVMLLFRIFKLPLAEFW